MTKQGVFVHSLPTFQHAGAPPASMCARVAGVPGDFSGCCWSGLGSALVVAPKSSKQDIRVYDWEARVHTEPPPPARCSF